MILVLAVASAPAAWSWRGLPGKVLAVLPPLVLGAAAYTYAPSPLLLVLAALVAHATSFVAPEPARASTRVGRELLLVGAAVLLAFGPGPLGYVIAIAIGLHAIAAQRTVRHVYFVELLVVGLYATLTRSLDLAPVLEAMLGLGYGFTLLGGATLTRRLGLTDVEIATRRFLAVLPVLVGLLTLEAAPSDTTALFALVASVLYATAAFTNESRAFAAAAAVAANGALVFFALAQGLDGIEIWLAPLGLVVAIMAQIFAPSLPPSARNILRVAGGVLLYLPAGLKVVRRLGAAEDPTYAVVFGTACLAGIAIGAALRIRAYLALATLSLVLDLIANLVHAGLRDHRLGFVLLSATGLAILGSMVLVTLRLEDARRTLDTIRRRRGAWE